MQTKIRVLLADDHPLIRVGIKTSLTAEPDLVLVGEAADGGELRRLTRELQPDVLLLDLRMPGPSPFATVAHLRQHCPGVKVLVLTAYDDEVFMRGLIAAGVAGYMLKDEATGTVARAVRAVANGDNWFSQPVLERLAELKARQTEESALTDRERQVLELMARGWDNARITGELCLAEQTVRNYVSRIYAKLAVSTRAEAIVWARERGLGKEA